ncbi:hypothetical protein J7E70_27580 [Variovorax paradoxus]|nr:hypothetical protein [Variovorax paradoxus]MBT2304201.1 hypothetical protein [Variovorax paradoxus]
MSLISRLNAFTSWPAHFSHINFQGTYRFNLEKYGHLLVERRSGKAAL